MFLVFIALITVLTLLLPVLAPRVAAHYSLRLHPSPVWVPIIAAILYFSAGFLPDIHISPETSTFQEHFIGGVYTALLFIYFTRLLGWKHHWAITLLALFAWTSALGTFNELFEFASVKLHFIDIDISDTSWDLVANTCGMLLTYSLWMISKSLARQR